MVDFERGPVHVPNTVYEKRGSTSLILTLEKYSDLLKQPDYSEKLPPLNSDTVKRVIPTNRLPLYKTAVSDVQFRIQLYEVGFMYDGGPFIGVAHWIISELMKCTQNAIQNILVTYFFETF